MEYILVLQAFFCLESFFLFKLPQITAAVSGSITEGNGRYCKHAKLMQL